MTLKFLQTLTLAIVFLCAQSISFFAQIPQWRLINSTREGNISGMALVEHSKQSTSFIIVHDNKKKNQVRAATITVEAGGAPKYTALKWLGEVPVDLEAITTIPDLPNNFLAFTSAGRVVHLLLDRADNSVKVIKSFEVPSIPAESEFEGFAVQKINNVLVAAWADRGLDAKPAQLFWSRFDLQNHTFAPVDSATIKVPYPTLDTRHISALKVDPSGAVFITAATDPGDDGPYTSAFYFAGTLSAAIPQRLSFTHSPLLTRLNTFDQHKIEAFEFVPGTNGGVTFGTDDENLGAAIFMNW